MTCTSQDTYLYMRTYTSWYAVLADSMTDAETFLDAQVGRMLGNCYGKLANKDQVNTVTNDYSIVVGKL